MPGKKCGISMTVSAVIRSLGNGSYFAPDLTKAIERKPKGYLKKFIMDPRTIKPNAAMPKLGLSEKEADDLIAFLDWMDQCGY